VNAWKLLTASFVSWSFAASLLAAGLPHGEPEAVGMDRAHLARIDEIVAQGLAEKRMPGCVVCIGRRGKIGSRRTAINSFSRAKCR
jgi:hypothetical protein